MRIGFDAKRAVQNFTGLGNYSRYLIEILYRFYPENEYFLYAPHIRSNPRFNHLLTACPSLFCISPKDYGKSAALSGAPSVSPVAWRKTTLLFITALAMNFHSISESNSHSKRSNHSRFNFSALSTMLSTH